MSDYNLYNFYDTDSGREFVYDDPMGDGTPTPSWSDTVKITSGCADFKLTADAIYGGKEDCVDINNRCVGIEVVANFHPQGKYVATIKGGVRGVLLKGILNGHGKEVDIDLGNWSDQSSQKTQGVKLDLVAYDQSPVTVRVLNAEKPVLVPGSGPYRYVFPHPDAWYHGLAVWFFFKFRKVFWK